MKRSFLILVAATTLGVLPLSLGAVPSLEDEAEITDIDLNQDQELDESVVIEDMSDAPTPILTETEVVVPEGASVEYSVQELQQLISAPGVAVLREYQEDPSNQRVIFESAEDAKRILGDTPRFIYFPEGPDPMIIPWIRERVVAEELFQEALVARTNRDFDRAKVLLREIQEKYPNTTEGQKAPLEIASIDNVIEAEKRAAAAAAENVSTGPVMPVAPAEDELVLPVWIRDNTNGIMMLSDGSHRVVVQNDFLGVGDPVPRFAMITVKEISDSEVVYTYQNKEFVLEVDGAF